jgi:hypothetical protein
MRWLDVVLGIAWVYAITFADRYFGWWPAMGLDFSTHTGVALAVGIAIARRRANLRWPIAAALVGYAAYMMWRGYHSALDIATSAAVVAPVPLLVPRRKEAK